MSYIQSFDPVWKQQAFLKLLFAMLLVFDFG